MAVTLASMMADVRPMMGGVIPEAQIRAALLWSAREFLAITAWLRETVVADIDQSANVPTLSVSDASTEIIGVQAAQLSDGTVLTPARQEDVAYGTQGFYFFDPPDALVLSWTPTASVTDGLYARVILNLLPSASSIPDALYRRWGQAISYGAISRLSGMKSSAWGDEQQRADYYAMFSNHIQAARREAEMQAQSYAYGYGE